MEFQLPPKLGGFVGRTAALASLTRLVVENGYAAVASTGLAGVGKSALVAEWARRMALTGRCGLVGVVRAETVSSVCADLLKLAERLRLRVPLDAGSTPVADRAKWVRQRLQEGVHGRVLLIFDNAEDEYKTLQPFLLTAPDCCNVFTARNRLLFPASSVLVLQPFHPRESLALVKLLINRRLGEEELAVAAPLCDEVGHLPLAVAQLASYAAVSGAPLQDVLSSVRELAAAAAPLVERVAGYARPESVIGALQRMQRKWLDKPSILALHCLALLAPDRVPRALLGLGVDTLTLGALSIVSFPDAGWVTTHRLVLMIARQDMSADDRHRAALVLVATMSEYTSHFSRFERSTWGSMRDVAAHAESLLGGKMLPMSCFARHADVWWTLVGRLFDYSVYCTSDYATGQRWAERLLASVGTLFHNDSVHVLCATRNLMIALRVQR